MAAGVARRGGKKNRKHKRFFRKPCNANDAQFTRTYQNKLARVNRDRAKSDKPPLTALAGYDYKGKPTVAV